MSYFASDNTAGVSDVIMQALQRANSGQMKSYGADEITAKLQEKMRGVFEHPTLRVFPVFNGSAANCVGLSHLVQSYEAIISHQHSHIQQDECGMPEFFSRSKDIGIKGENGKINIDEVHHVLDIAANGGMHHVRPKVISITQSTEVGTVYTMEEVQAISYVAKAHDMYLHMDGARIANAVASFGCSPAEMTWRAGVDVLSFGGTKNGAMLAEAIVFFDEKLAESFDYRRKQAGQLASKQRYLSAQLLALLENNHWLENARHSNLMAQLLAKGLSDCGIEPLFPVQANAVFVRLNDELFNHLRACDHYFYRWELLGKDVYRLVTSFATTEQEVEAFVRDCGKKIRAS
jgi:threonine aldolase